MSHARLKKLKGQRRRAAIAVLVAFLMVVFVAMAAFSINVAQMQLVRTELRAATDASARAGAEALSRTQDGDAAIAAAIAAAARNTTAGVPLLLTADDITLGASTLQSDGTWAFTPGAEPFTAIRVLGNRTASSQSGEVPLFFGALLGVDSFAPFQTATASQLDRDICIVLDRSGSMAFDLSGKNWSYPPGIPGYPDGYCLPPHPTLSRWAAATAAFEAFVVELEGTSQDEHLSVVTFATHGHWCSGSHNASDIEIGLTPNFTAVRTALALRSAQPIPGGTSISSGIDDAVVVLTGADVRPLAAKTIVLLTDGVHNSGRSPIDAAVDAEASNIVIHTVTFSNGADQKQMIKVADVTGGNHYHAPDAQALRDAFREIALTLPIVLTD